MKVGIKYCGGCNPKFNRREFIERLIDEHKENSYEPAFLDSSYDVVLVVCGCSNGCAKHENLKVSSKLIITSGQDYVKASKILN